MHIYWVAISRHLKALEEEDYVVHDRTSANKPEALRQLQIKRKYILFNIR